jgi:UDP-2,3-diacylglucosamine hydrolase
MLKSSPSSSSSSRRNAASPSKLPRSQGRGGWLETRGLRGLRDSARGERIGLIAGNGDFPQLTAAAARRQGLSVVAVAFPEETRPALAGRVDEIHWQHIGELGKLIKTFQRAGVRRAVMAGQIRHKRLFANLKVDWHAVTLLAGLKDKRADSILRAVADSLAKQGIRLESPLPLLAEHMAKPGVLTRRRPTAAEAKDVAFGHRLAKHVAGADIGQTVVVKNQAVLAVEAMEGTDACILRAGQFTRSGGTVVVKVTKPGQDLRFDMPVIGPRTIRSMIKAGASVLAFDAAATLLLQKDLVLSLANRSRLSLIALAPEAK